MPYPIVWKKERWITMSYQNESHLQFTLKHSELQWGKVAGVWRLLTHPRIATEMESVWRSDAWQEEGRGGKDGHNVPRFKGAGGKLILIRSDVQQLIRFWELHLFTSPWTERALCALRCLKQWAFVQGHQGTWVNLVTLDVFVYVMKRRGRDRHGREDREGLRYSSVFRSDSISK